MDFEIRNIRIKNINYNDYSDSFSEDIPNGQSIEEIVEVDISSKFGINEDNPANKLFILDLVIDSTFDNSPLRDLHAEIIFEVNSPKQVSEQAEKHLIHTIYLQCLEKSNSIIKQTSSFDGQTPLNIDKIIDEEKKRLHNWSFTNKFCSFLYLNLLMPDGYITETQPFISIFCLTENKIPTSLQRLLKSDCNIHWIEQMQNVWQD